MQTHSRYGDARREAIITQLARLGAPVRLIEDVYACNTTEAAIACIHAAGLDAVWDHLAEAARRYCRLRTGDAIEIEVVFVDAQGSVLGQCMEESE